jgi:mono/diheme cytochrome c family protein
MFALGWLSIAVAVCAGWIVSAQTTRTGGQDGAVIKGQKLFAQYCASCHGTDGRGKGPVAAALKQGPPDLTIIQAPGEKFPFSRVQIFIDGEKEVAAHGSRKMPVWGTVFRRTSGDLQSHADIYALAKYVESIQTSAK